jgi:CHAT domain-containing protein
LAAYVERNLTPDERAEVDAHLAACGDCFALVAEVIRTVDDMDGRAVEVDARGEAPADATTVVRPVFGGRRVWFAAASVLATAALVLLVVRTRSDRPQSETDYIAKLAAVNRQERPTEGRLSGLPHVPLRTTVRSGEAGPDNLQLLAVVGELQVAARTSSTAANLHALGIGQLLLDQVDAGIRSLEQAVDVSPADAAIQSDLSAAYLARSRQPERAQDVAAALAAAERALTIEPQKSEALFNRAVALEFLHLRDAARQAWRTYLANDVASPWAAEARTRLDALEKVAGPGARWKQHVAAFESEPTAGNAAALAAEFPANTREWLEDVVLARWAAGELAGEPDRTARAAREARLVAEALHERHADATLMPLVEAMSAPDRKRVASGYHQYAQGRQVYDRDQIVASRPYFQKAAEHLAATGNPLLLNARFHDALTVYFEGRLDDAARQLAALGADAGRARHESLLALVHWRMGIIHGSQTRFSESIAEYQRGLEIYAARGEKDLLGNMHHLIADALTTLGDPAGAWEHILPALRLHSESWNPRRRYNAYVTALRAARMYGFPEAARALHGEILNNAPFWGPAGAILEAHVELARAEAAASGPAAAEVHLEDAAKLLEAVTDNALRWRVETQFIRARAEILADFDPTRAISALETAARRYEGAGSTIQMASLRLGLGRAYRKVNRLDDAERELKAGIELVETQRRTVVQSQLRISHFDRVWDVFEEMVQLQLQRGDRSAAFEYAERGRARTLMDARAWIGPIPSVSDVAARLPDRTALVYLSVLSDRFIAWVVARDAVHFLERPTPRGMLQRLATRILAAQAAGQPQFLQHALEEAHDELIEPIRAWVAAGTHLYIAADGPLQSVPFAALRDKRTGTFLGIEHPIAIVPNARALLATVRRPADATQALVVGASGAHVSGLRSLQPLPFAEAEAAHVAKAYPRATLWTGAHATPDAFLRGLPSADVVHFAGHAIANAQYPLLSHLVLSPSEGTPGELFSFQLADVRLRPWSTVVLAGCGTGAGRAARGEGSLSIARPFITGGAAEVIATIWDLPDKEALSLFDTVHAYLRAGAPAHLALWQARRAAFSSEQSALNDPSFWGGVVAYAARRFEPS